MAQDQIMQLITSLKSSGSFNLGLISWADRTKGVFRSLCVTNLVYKLRDESNEPN